MIALWLTLAAFLLVGTTIRSMAVLPIVVIAIALGWQIKAAYPHDIYSNLHNQRTGMLCCNGRVDENGMATGDCEPTLAIAGKDSVRFWVRGQQWVTVPNEQVTFMDLPNETMAFRKDYTPPEPNMIWGHFCGIPTTSDGPNVHDGWLVYCSFYAPGGS